VNNLPTDVVRQMGADVVIAVHLRERDLRRRTCSRCSRSSAGPWTSPSPPTRTRGLAGPTSSSPWTFEAQRDGLRAWRHLHCQGKRGSGGGRAGAAALCNGGRCLGGSHERAGSAPAPRHAAAAVPARGRHGRAGRTSYRGVPRAVRGEADRREAARPRPDPPQRDRKVQPRRLSRRPRERARRPDRHGGGERLRAPDAPARHRARRDGRGQRRVHRGRAADHDGPGRVPFRMADGRELRLHLRDPQRVLPAAHGVEQVVRGPGGARHEHEPPHRRQGGPPRRIPHPLRRAAADLGYGFSRFVQAAPDTRSGIATRACGWARRCWATQAGARADRASGSRTIRRTIP
jgi:hypothetical protein